MVKRNLLVAILFCTASLLIGAMALADGGAGDGTVGPSTGGMFSDVPRDHWAYDDLVYLAERGIITSLPGGQYRGTEPLDRYSAAAMIARAVRYLQNNPESVTPQDLEVLKNLIFEVSDNLSVLQSQIDSLSGGSSSGLESRVSQNEQQIAQLQEQGVSGKVLNRVNANFIISLTALLVGIIAVALATLGL